MFWRRDDVNRAAQELGRLARGVPKSLTEAERKRRAEALAKAREKRWPKKVQATRKCKARGG